MAAESFHLSTIKSEATPVNADDPVKEFDADSPDGRFMKQDGEVRDEKEAVFHIQRPCPNRALKSPIMTLPHEWFQRRLPEYRVGQYLVES